MVILYSGVECNQCVSMDIPLILALNSRNEERCASFWHSKMMICERYASGKC